MKLSKLSKLITGAVLATSLSVSASTDSVQTRVGELNFKGGYPTQETMHKMINEMDFQRATQAYIWSIPLAGVMEWTNASRNELGLKELQPASYFSFEQKKGIITSNFTTPYVAATGSLADTGPMVLELPEGRMAGMLLDVHQRVLSDLSLLGPDKGKGGKYLIAPPGYEDLNPEGYHVIHSKSNFIFIGLRIISADIEKDAKKLLPNINTYPYNDGKLGKKLPVVSSPEVEWSSVPKDGMAYWKTVHQWLQEEAIVEERDRFMVAFLKELGIEKGKPFAPTKEQTKILLEAEKVGRAMAQSNDYIKRFDDAFWAGTHWKDAVSVSLDQRKAHYDEIDERAAWFWEAITVSRGMKSTIPGFGQRYIVTYQDADGEFLYGEHTYKLTVPADVPAKNFWSLTVYGEQQRTMIQNDTGTPDISSRKKNLKVNDDGSVDVYIGPKPVKGFENNWIQSNPGKGWFPYFRFYGPTERMFNKEWTMGDIERIK